MFDWFKSKRARGAVAFDFDIEIERPASEVYQLIDWTSPRNARRELGGEIVPIAGAANRFRLTLPEMPDLLFDFTVTEAVPSEVYAYACEITPKVGRLVHSTERFTFDPTGDTSCILRLEVEAEFIDGMTSEEYEFELFQMSTACHNSLAKYKLHAEEGVDAVRAVEHRLIV